MMEKLKLIFNLPQINISNFNFQYQNNTHAELLEISVTHSIKSKVTKFSTK